MGNLLHRISPQALRLLVLVGVIVLLLIFFASQIEGF